MDHDELMAAVGDYIADMPLDDALVAVSDLIADLHTVREALRSDKRRAEERDEG